MTAAGISKSNPEQTSILYTLSPSEPFLKERKEGRRNEVKKDGNKRDRKVPGSDSVFPASLEGHEHPHHPARQSELPPREAHGLSRGQRALTCSGELGGSRSPASMCASALHTLAGKSAGTEFCPNAPRTSSGFQGCLVWTQSRSVTYLASEVPASRRTWHARSQ